MDTCKYVYKKGKGFIVRGSITLITSIIFIAAIAAVLIKYGTNSLTSNGITTTNWKDPFYLALAISAGLLIISLLMNWIDAFLILFRKYKLDNLNKIKWLFGLLTFIAFFVPVLIFGSLCKKKAQNKIAG